MYNVGSNYSCASVFTSSPGRRRLPLGGVGGGGREGGTPRGPPGQSPVCVCRFFLFKKICSQQEAPGRIPCRGAQHPRYRGVDTRASTLLPRPLRAGGRGARASRLRPPGRQQLERWPAAQVACALGPWGCPPGHGFLRRLTRPPFLN